MQVWRWPIRLHSIHKWLYQPYEIGCTLVRNWQVLKESYFNQADYLSAPQEPTSDRLEFNEHYFQLSRNAKAFKVWMSLKAYGFARIQAMMQKDIDLTRYLERRLNAASDFELKSNSDLAIACFRYTGSNLSPASSITANQKRRLTICSIPFVLSRRNFN